MFLSACNRIEIAYGNFDVRKLAACTRDSNIVFHILCGWMATKDALSLQSETENDPNVVCMIDNKTDESKVPPTKLKNPKFAKSNLKCTLKCTVYQNTANLILLFL